MTITANFDPARSWTVSADLLPSDRRKAIQAILGVTQDGSIGPKTLGALDALVHASDPAPAGSSVVHAVIASDFASPADLAAFRAAKARGETDQQAFAVGDNCIGKWGTFTGDANGVPMCALPPEDWEQFGSAAAGKKVAVTIRGVRVIHELRDTMPHRVNIENGAGIDLNPASLKAFGMHSPIMEPATWEWA